MVYKAPLLPDAAIKYLYFLMKYNIIKNMRRPKPSNSIESIKKIGIFSWSIIGFLIILALILYLIFLVRIAVIPILLALAIGYLLGPLVRFFQKKMRKGFAVALTYLLFIELLFIVFFFVIPIITDQFRVFIDRFPSYLQNLDNTINNFIRNSVIAHNIENFLGKKIVAPDTNAIIQYIMNRINFGELDILQTATVFTRSIINIILYIIVGPILGIYILMDADKIKTIFIKALPRRSRLQAAIIIDKINRVAGRYIRAQILVSIIVGVLCTIVLLILRIDLAILLGFIAGLLNIIPLVGPIIGAVPAALAALFISPLKALLVIILFIAIQQIDNYVISPNIMKYQVRVHPGLIILSLMAGGALFGFWGLIIAVPIVAILQETLKYYLFEKNKTAS